MTKRARHRRRWWHSPLAVVGVLVVTAALGAGGYLGWQYFASNWFTDYADDLAHIRQQWSAQVKPAPVKAGEGYAVLRIPKFGTDYEVPVIAGIDDADLRRGIGSYPSAVAVGEPGNFAIAGLRVGYGQPLRNLVSLDVGDEIVVETATAIHTYRLDTRPANLTVNDDVGWVLDPVPGKPGHPADQPIITITTSQDLWPSSDRTVAFGRLVGSKNK